MVLRALISIPTRVTSKLVDDYRVPIISTYSTGANYKLTTTSSSLIYPNYKPTVAR